MRFFLNLLRPACPHCSGEGGFTSGYYQPEWSGCELCNKREDNDDQPTRVWRWQWWRFRFHLWHADRLFDRLGHHDDTTYALRRQIETYKERDARPAEFLQWAVDTFGRIALDRRERMLRFAEEAIELAHADGLDESVLHRLINRVYSRPRGSIGREIGQSQATLELFAESIGASAEREARREWERVRAVPQDEWRRRHKVKVDAGIAS